MLHAGEDSQIIGTYMIIHLPCWKLFVICQIIACLYNSVRGILISEIFILKTCIVLILVEQIKNSILLQ